MKFSEIAGHEGAKRTLQEYVGSRRIPHAVMLEGPAGTPKMSLARAYAQLLHCRNPKDGEPCGTCPACRMHARIEHPDLHFVYPVIKRSGTDPVISADYFQEFRELLTEFPDFSYEQWINALKAENKQPRIYVSEADEIVRADAYPAYSEKYKIFLVYLPEKLQPEAANSLLKVVEEPSEGTIFIFVSDNPLQVLPTISSRTQRITVGAEGAADAAKADPEEMAKFREIFQTMMRMAYAARPRNLKELADKTAGLGRERISRLLTYVNSQVRDNFLYRFHNASLLTLTPEEFAFSRNFAPYIHQSNVEDIIAETDRARIDIERNGNAKIVLFDYFLLLIVLLRRRPK